MRTLRVTLVLAALLGGCGGDDDSGGNIELANLPTVMSTEYCKKAFACCTVGEIPEFFEGAPFTDEPSCIQFYQNAFSGLLPSYQASIDADRMTYSGSAMSTCIAALRSQTCADFASAAAGPLQNDCENPFQGLQANTRPCAYDEECMSGYCEGEVQFGTPMPGVCKQVPAENQPCPDVTCSAGLYCTTQNDTCVPQKADGAPCVYDEDCLAGACNGATSEMGTCGVSAICNGL